MKTTPGLYCLTPAKAFRFDLRSVCRGYCPWLSDRWSVFALVAFLTCVPGSMATTTSHELSGTFSSPGPMMELRTAHPLEILPIDLETSTAETILQSYIEGLPPPPVAVSTGWDTFTEAFDLTATFNAFTEDVAGLPFFSRFNAISGEIGLVFALHQFSQEIKAGEETTAKLNLSKNLMMYSLGKWGSQSIKIANIGLFLIDYSLTKFGTEGLRVREARYQRLYDNFNANFNQHRKSREGWVQFLVAHAERREGFEDSLNRELEKYLHACFDEEGSMIPDDVRPILVQKERFKVLEMIKPALEEALQELERLRWLAVENHLREMRDLFNKKVQLRVHVKAGEYGLESTRQRIRGLPVRVLVERDQHLWEGVTCDAGHWWFDFTWLAYVFYGLPKWVELEYQGQVFTAPIEIEYGRFSSITIHLPAGSVSIIEPRERVHEAKGSENEIRLRFSAKSNLEEAHEFEWTFDDGYVRTQTVEDGSNSSFERVFSPVLEDISRMVTVTVRRPGDPLILARDSKIITLLASNHPDEEYDHRKMSIPPGIRGQMAEILRQHGINLEEYQRSIDYWREDSFVLRYRDAETGQAIASVGRLGELFSIHFVKGEFGLQYRWNINGTLIWETFHLGGRAHGVWRKWYPNGQPQFIGEYSQGEKIGVHEEWHENGIKRSEIQYPGGFLRRWYENGNLLHVTNRNEEGFMHGESISYYYSGRVRARGHYRNGRHVGVWHYRRSESGDFVKVDYDSYSR